MKRAPQKWQRILPALGLMAFVLLTGSASAAFKNVELGMKAPEISGRDMLSGNKINTQDLVDEGAEAVVVVFWATWSPRSIELLGDLKELQAKVDDDRLRILAVNVEGETISPATRTAIENLMNALAPPFPVMLDQGLELFHEFGVIAVPSSAVFDGRHVLRADPAGYSLVVRKALSDSITVLLGGEVAVIKKVLKQGYQPSRRARRYYNKGIKLAAKGLLERAMIDAEKSAAADTGFSSPHALQGRILLGLGEADQAAAAYDRACRLDSNSVVALAGWGRALLTLGELNEARPKLEKAIELDVAYTPALLDLATCLLAQQDNAGGAARLQEAFELNPRDPETLYRRGLWLRSQDKIAEALAAYRTALNQLGHH